MNSCCTLYHIDPLELSEKKCVVLENNNECTGSDCNCGYIQFESLVPYLPRLTNNYTKDQDHLVLEAKLRQQIVEVSRFFDSETNVESGTYSKAHYKIIKVYGDGSRYLKVPNHVNGTLELYTSNGYLINPASYAYIDGFLVFQPCLSHTPTCGCNKNCGLYDKKTMPQGWNGCFQIKAKFGKECADQVVQLAVRSYLIEYNTYGDVKETNFQGLPVSRGFKVPHVWSSTVQSYLQKKRFQNRFSFA